MKTLILSLMVLFVTVGCAGAAPTVIVVDDKQACWNPPITNVDGSAITDGAGFYIYWSSISNVYSDLQRQQVAGWFQICVQFANISGLLPQDIYFTVTAYDASGNESQRSNQAKRKFGNASEVPNGATGLTSK